jgi:hypothetical protein
MGKVRHTCHAKTGTEPWARPERCSGLRERWPATRILVRAVSLEERGGAPARAYRGLRDQTRESWTRERLRTVPAPC